MHLELASTFRISIYTLLGVSSVALAIAEGGAIPTAITIPLAIAALLTNEFSNLIRLTARWANALGVIALVVAALEYTRGDLEGRLLAGAHLLVYISWIVMFQQKSANHYWWICALSVLQMAVASVLTDALWFGFLLIAYMFLAVWTLSLLCLYESIMELAGTNADGYQDDPTSGRGDPLATGSSVIGPERARPRRTTNGLLSGPVEASTAESIPPGANVSIDARYAGGIFGVSSGALCIGAVFFVFIPRLWLGDWSQFASYSELAIRPMTGFTEEVQLGDMGQILESSEKVLEIKMIDSTTSKEIDVDDYAQSLGYDEPLFRGSVLEVYRDGRWTTGYPLRRLPPPLNLTDGTPSVRQEIRSSARGTRILFTMHPLLDADFEGADGWISQHRTSGVLVLRGIPQENGAITYVAHSPKSVTPRTFPPLATYSSAWLGQETRKRCTALPELGLERLKVLAIETVLKRAPDRELRRLSDRDKAMALVSYLRDSNTYHYSLDLSIQDPAVDPLEDFLFNRKQGHCEYFASALVLMLRSLDVPARLVSGFKGGTNNSITHHFEVQQRHAHAWVEAFIGNQWVVLDATPASRGQSVAGMSESGGTWDDIKSYVRDSWLQHVLNVSFVQQEENIYQPLATSALESWSAIKQLDWISRERIRSIIDFVKSPDRWFSWQGGLAAFSLMLLTSGVVWTTGRFFRFAKRLRFALRTRRFGDRVSVDFYERFQRAVRKAGLVRESPQTHREFGVRVEHRLRTVLLPAGLAGLPADVIDAFYRVRFGGEHLESAQLDDLNQLLTRFEECLSAAKLRRS